MLLSTLLATIASAATTGHTAYTVAELTSSDDRVTQIDDQGHIAVTLYQNVPQTNAHAALLRNGSLLDLGTLPGRTNSIALGLNNHDAVVGVSNSGGWFSSVFLWQDGAMTDLGGGSAIAINDAGQIVGDSDPDGGRGHVATVWTVDGRAFLGTLPGDDESFGSAINRYGQVVGQSGSGGNARAFFYDGTTMIHVGDLGDPYDGRGGAASALNDAGDVVGWVPTSEDRYHYEHAFLWHDGVTTDLTPQGDVIGHATAINNLGQVVGWGRKPPTNEDPSYYGYAFVYTDGQIFDLNKLIPAKSGWVIQTPVSINASGQIVGLGTLNGEPRSFLLTPRKPSATRPKR